MKPTLLLIPKNRIVGPKDYNAGTDTNLKKVSGIQTFPASVIVKYFIRPANANSNTNTNTNSAVQLSGSSTLSDLQM